MPATNKVTVHFKASGDQALVRAIQELHLAQVRLEKGTKAYSRAVKRLKLDKAKLNKEFGLTTKNSRLVSNSFATLRSKLLLASFAAGLFSKTVGKLTSLYAEQEAAEKRLSTALGFTSQRLLEFASAQQQITTFGDEVTISAMAQAAAFTKNEEALKQITVAAQDFSSARGVDLKTAMDLISKSVFSSTNALSRYGIEIDNTLKGTDRFNAMMRALNEKFGGQATAELDTYAGATKSLKNAFGDLGEVLGKDLAEALLPVVKLLSDMAVLLSSLPLGSITQGFTSLAGAIFLTDKSLKTLKTTMVLAATSTKKAAGAVALLSKGLKFFTKAGFIFMAIEGIGRLVSGFASSKKEIKETTKEIVHLEQGIVDLDQRLAGVRTISDAINLKAFVEAEADITTTKLDQVTTSIAHYSEFVNRSQKILDKWNKAGEAWTYLVPELATETIKLGEAEGILTGELTHTITAEEKLFNLYQSKQRDLEKLNALNTEKNELTGEQVKLLAQLVEVEALRDKMQLQNLAWQANLIPNLAKEIELLENKTKFSGAELELENLLTEARSRQIELSPKRIADMRDMINNKTKLNNVMKQEVFLANSFNQALLQGINNNARFAESFGNMIKKMAAQMVAHMATFVLFNILTGGTFGAGMTAFQYGINKMTGSAMGGAAGGASSGGSASGAMQGISLENQNSAMQGGSGSVVVNFSGNVMSDDFIENQAIPQIQEAIRRGADLGVG